MLNNYKSCKHHAFGVTFVRDIKTTASASATLSPDSHQKNGVTAYSCMKTNETHIDSVIRIFSSVLLLYVGLSGELTGPLAVMAVILGVILLLTGAVGFCPLYALFRYNRRK